MARKTPPIVLALAGKRIKVRFCRSVKVKENGLWHECWADYNHATGEIRIHESLRGRDLLDAVIHEMEHDSFPWLREEIIDASATNIADVLSHPEIESRIWEQG